MKLNVTTVVEVHDIEISWAIFEALKKAYKDIAIVDDELIDDDDAEGYSFTFQGTMEVDLIELEHEIRSIVTKTVRKEKKEDIEKQAKAKKELEGFKPFELKMARNPYAKMMDEVIKTYNDRIQREIVNEDFDQALCYANDGKDLIAFRNVLDTGSRKEALAFRKELDTIVREHIPEKVYDYLNNENWL